MSSFLFEGLCLCVTSLMVDTLSSILSSGRATLKVWKFGCQMHSNICQYDTASSRPYVGQSSTIYFNGQETFPDTPVKGYGNHARSHLMDNAGTRKTVSQRCTGTKSWRQSVATLLTQGHDVDVIQVYPILTVMGRLRAPQ